MTTDHEPIVSQCIGCCRVFKEALGDKREICGCHPFPRMRWLGGFPCDDASHLKKNHDYEEGSHYDNRKNT